MTGLDTFNIAAGLVTIISAIVTVWFYVRKQRTQAVEKEKNRHRFERIRDIQSRLNAIAKNTAMLAVLADRDEVSKKELKHLAVAQLNYLEELIVMLKRGETEIQTWVFGVPEEYITIPKHPNNRSGTVSGDEESHQEGEGADEQK